MKPSGAIGFYHPDWVVVQKLGKSEVNWIIETKGRVWEGTTAKDEAIHDWCERVSAYTSRADTAGSGTPLASRCEQCECLGGCRLAPFGSFSRRNSSDRVKGAV